MKEIVWTKELVSLSETTEMISKRLKKLIMKGDDEELVEAYMSLRDELAARITSIAFKQ